jgi:choline dehydrogenase-like flavoprotein
MKVIIVGAGVLGVSVARQLAVAGEDVLLLDRRGADTDTTAITCAWTNCKPEPGPPPAEPRRDGRGAPSYFPSGALQWADAANEQRLADPGDHHLHRTLPQRGIRSEPLRDRRGRSRQRRA